MKLLAKIIFGKDFWILFTLFKHEKYLSLKQLGWGNMKPLNCILLSSSINFKDPQFAEDYIFKAVMLPGAR